MKVTADSKGAITSPELFTPGTTYESVVDSQGQVILRPVLPKSPKRVTGKLVRRGGRLIMESPSELAPEAIADAVRRERDSRS